jgi:protein-tyrosine phosphatase
MFGLFKKKAPQASGPVFEILATDMHSHLLPGIDDGSPDVATSMQLMKGLVKLGYQKFICTPHIYKELYPNTKATIKAAYEQLLPVVQAELPGVELRYAAEYYLDDHFDALLAGPDKLLTIKDNWVLVEYSFLSPPLDLKEKIFNLQMEGYQPVLAHPERYGYYAGNKKAYDELYDAGCIFQLNLLSLAGYYGKSPAELAHYLIQRGYVKLLGTDLHHDRHLDGLHHPALAKIVMQLHNSGSLLNTSL